MSCERDGQPFMFSKTTVIDGPDTDGQGTGKMKEIIGKVNTAVCFARTIEPEAEEQIRRMCDYEFTKGSVIRIMPDVHAGKGCTIGTTMTVTDKAVPNIVGVDIGCGMYTVSSMPDPDA